MSGKSELAKLRKQRAKHPQSRAMAAQEVVTFLRAARDSAIVAGAPKTLERIRHALKSAEGAVRHATCMETRGCGALRPTSAALENATRES